MAFFRRRRPASSPVAVAPSAPAPADPWHFEHPYDFTRTLLYPLVLISAVNSGLLAHIQQRSPATRSTLSAEPTFRNQGMLQALLDALVAFGIVTDTEGSYRLTARGEALVPGGRLHDEVALAGSQMLPTWLAIPAALDADKVPYEVAQGAPFYGYMGGHPATGAQFQHFMTTASSAVAAPLASVAAPLLARLTAGLTHPVLVDIGGASAVNMIALLHAVPTLHGIIYDMPPNLASARQALANAGLTERCQVAGGTMFEQVPSGDVFLLSQVLHDFDDAQAHQVLAQCAAQQPHGILLFEQVLPNAGAPPPSTAAMNFIMHSLFGTGERSLAAYQTLLADVGYHITSADPASAAPQWVIVAEPAERA
ncbi:MAG: hypothetical protein H0X24_00675 [Ktedonobacterales bacterium]|nr:hypothetical protein [Ktedonobacterales bacterium]